MNDADNVYGETDCSFTIYSCVWSLRAEPGQQISVSWRLPSGAGSDRQTRLRRPVVPCPATIVFVVVFWPCRISLVPHRAVTQSPTGSPRRPARLVIRTCPRYFIRRLRGAGHSKSPATIVFVDGDDNDEDGQLSQAGDDEQPSRTGGIYEGPLHASTCSVGSRTEPRLIYTSKTNRLYVRPTDAIMARVLPLSHHDWKPYLIEYRGTCTAFALEFTSVMTVRAILMLFLWITM